MLPSVVLRAMILMHIVVWVMIHQLIQLILTLEKPKLWSQLAAFWLPLVNFQCIFLDHFAVHRLNRCSPFRWQIKPARATFSRPNKITIVIIPSQPGETNFEVFQHLKSWKLFCIIILIGKKLTSNFEIKKLKKNNGWTKYRKNDSFDGVQLHLFRYINKTQVCCQKWDSNPHLQE